MFIINKSVKDNCGKSKKKNGITYAQGDSFILGNAIFPQTAR